MEKALEHAKENFPKFMDKLKELVKIPSVSFDGFPPEKVEDSANAVAQLLKEEGLENIEILKINISFF